MTVSLALMLALIMLTSCVSAMSITDFRAQIHQNEVLKIQGAAVYVSVDPSFGTAYNFTSSQSGNLSIFYAGHGWNMTVKESIHPAPKSFLTT